MNKKRNDKNENINEKSINARRRIIKAIAGTSGAVVAGKTLPENWTRPAIDMALLPAHAQTSVCTEICNLDVRLNWSAQSSIDLDLELLTPGGHRIAPKAENGEMFGNCLEHNGDDSGPGAVSESISNIGSGVTPGHYAVYLRNNSLQGFGGTITVSGCLDLTIGTGATAGAVVRVLSFDIPEVP